MDDTKSIRLASYNIRKCLGLDRRRSPGRIVDVINGIGADVVALQEADRRLGERPAALPAQLIEDETDFRVVSRAPDGPSLGWHGNAILVRKALAVEELCHLELPGTEPRGAVAIVVAGNLRVLATHLGLRRSDRRRQTEVIARYLIGQDVPAVIMGDLNEWSASRGLEPLNAGFATHSPGHSFHAARPIAALDRIALSNGLELMDAAVVENRLTKIASDHLPIWADVNLRGVLRHVD